MVRAPYLTLAMVSAIALAAAAPTWSQASADPGRSPDAAFVAKASDATAVDAELAALAVTRAKATAVKAFAKEVLAGHHALAHGLATMGRTAPLAGAPHAEPVAADETPASAKTDRSAGAPPPDAMSAVAVLRSKPAADFDAAFVAAMVASREAVVALFDAESREGRDAEVKEWAARQLPALRTQLVTARALRSRPGR